MKKALYYIIPFLLILLQTSNIVNNLKIGNVKPDFILTFVVYYSLTSSFIKSETLGFFIGLLFDIISNTLIGINTFCLTAISTLLNLFKTKIFVEKSFSVFTIVFLTSIFYRLIYFILTIIFINKLNFYKTIVKIAIPEAFYTAIVAIILFPIYNKIFTNK